MQAQSISRDSLNRLIKLANTNTQHGIARANTLNALADACLKYNMDSAKMVAEQAIALSKQINYIKGEADALLSLTYYYTTKADFGKGMEASQQSTVLFEQVHDLSGLAEAQIQIAFLYKKIGGHKRTEEYILQGLAFGRRGYETAAAAKDTAQMIDAINTQGIIYRDWAKKEGKAFYFDSALRCYGMALHLIEQSRGRQDENLAMIYNNMSQVYSEYKKDYNKALSYLQMAIDNNKRFGKVSSLSYNYGNISGIYRSLGNPQKSLEYAYKMLDITKIKNQPDRMGDAYSALSDAYEFSHRYDSALFYYKLETDITDSTLNLEKTAQIADMQTKYQTLKKESEIALLNTSNKTKTRNISYLIGGVFLLAALSVAMLILYQRVKKQKAQLQEQSAKLQWMMKELHHRVKNNLQIVSSLLNLQTYRMKDEASVTALSESNLRVQAMSLIHQRLYQAEDASLVNFKLFITDLTETLMSAYGFATDDFDLHINISEEMLPVDTVLPLGLMTNEILTNSFKYAYKNVQRPALFITLERNGQQLIVDIADNGSAIGESSNQATPSGFGTSLITAFTKQLHATCTIDKDNGMAYHFTIPMKTQKTA